MIGDIFEGIGRAVFQPVADAVDLIDGLTEGELRERAAYRFGGAAVAGMTAAELVEWWQTKDD